MVDVDPNYEFDAPQFYDFRRTSLGVSEASQWFDARDVQELEPASPLGENRNLTNTQPKTAPGTSKKEPTTAKKRNIVTSWGVQNGTAAAVNQPSLKSVPAKATQAPKSAMKPGTAIKRQLAVAHERMGAAMTVPAKRTVARTQAPQPSTAKAPVLGKRSAKEAGNVRTADVRMPQKAKLAAAAPTSLTAHNAQPHSDSHERFEQRITRSASKKRVVSDSGAAATAPSAASKPTTASKAKGTMKNKTVQAAVAKARAARNSRQVATKAASSTEPVQAAHPRALSASAAVPKHAQTAKSAAAAARAQAKAKGTVVGKQMRVSHDKLKKVLLPKKVVPVRSTQPLTLPEEPELHVNKRARRCPAAEEAGSKTPFKALQLKVKEFHSKTPGRFKSRPAPVEPAKPLHLTQAKTPLLHTTARARPSKFKPHDVEEEEEVAAMPKFHALPVNHELLNSGRLPSAQPTEKRAPTQPQPFSFVTDTRGERRRRQVDEEEEEAQFKAKPVNKAILEAPAGLPKKPRMSLTIPKSPLLLTKTRVHEPKVVEEEVMEFKARPVPDFLQVPQEFHSTREPLLLTQPQPFQLATERRGRMHRARMLTKLQEEEMAAAAARQMRAQLLPGSTDMPVLPHKPEPKPLTVPHPFGLRSEARHGAAQALLHSQVLEEEELRRAELEFKARPMWQGRPFKPRESAAPLTVPEEVPLATEARACDRAVFDALVEEKQEAIEAEKQAALEAVRQAEEVAVREYRRSLRFKANPMPVYGPAPAPLPSLKPLTHPVTPKLGRKRKADA